MVRFLSLSLFQRGKQLDLSYALRQQNDVLQREAKCLVGNVRYKQLRKRLLPPPCIAVIGYMTLLGPGGYPRNAFSLPIYGLTANICQCIPLSNGVRKKTEEASRTMQKSVFHIISLCF